MDKVLQTILYVLNLPLLPIGKTTVTLAMLLYIVLLFTVLIYVSRILQQRLLEKLLQQSKLDRHMQHFFSMLCHYSFVGIGGVIILNTAGIEMTALTVVAGALGLGLSLGLQSIAKNIAGGIMILVERPVKIGDRVQIGSTTGDITRIALRSTTIHTDDHIDIIVPNMDFMDQRVCNWSNSTKDIILTIPIVVSADNDLSQVKEIVLNSTKQNPRVKSEPAPEVLLESFEAGKLKLTIRIATEDFVSAATNRLKSELNNDIYLHFKQHQINLG